MKKLRTFLSKNPENPVMLISAVVMLIVMPHAKSLDWKIELCLIALWMLMRFCNKFFEDIKLRKAMEVAEKLENVFTVILLFVSFFMLLSGIYT